MAQSFNIDFKILVGNRRNKVNWILVDQLLGKSQSLVDYYVSIENLHCCNFQGGFFIDVDGKPWSDEGAVDEFWMTAIWFTALKEILFYGEEITMARPWEESNLILKRIGDELELEDIYATGAVSMPKVRVLFIEFIEQILRDGKNFSELVNEIKHEIRIRRTDGVSKEMEAKLKEIEKSLPEGIEEEIAGLVIELKTKKASMQKGR